MSDRRLTTKELLESTGDEGAADQLVQWVPGAWRARPGLGGFAPLFKQLEKNSLKHGGLRRRAVLKAARKGTPAEALVATMVWGFGTIGYGPARTVAMLSPTGESDRDQILEEIVDAARTSPADGFGALFDRRGRARLPRLGVAYGTRFLHFTAYNGKGTAKGPQPLVYDSRVSRGLSRVDGAPGIHASTGYVPSADYQSYCRWAHKVAAKRGCAPADVEHALFRVGG